MRMRRGSARSEPEHDAEMQRSHPRVALRSPSMRDRDEFLELVRRSRELHRPWVFPPKNANEFADYIKRTRQPDFEALLLYRRGDRAMVGLFNVSQIFYGALCSAYLGFWIGAPYAGQGYMTEGMGLVLRHVFRVLELHRIEANIQPGNVASIALARKTGFRREGLSPRYLKVGGRWRDHERWAITVEDFRGGRRSGARRGG
jgi:[ribosomal protein S5]-alanine N-acetyltransferase